MARKLLLWIVLPILLLLIITVSYFYFNSRFKGDLELVEFKSDIQLQGALIKPPGDRPHPAIILIHGAGGAHQQYDKLYFRFHANAFVKKGFAVLVYSKRSSKNSDYENFTYEKLCADAQAALDFLKSRNDIDQNQIGVMGVSESGWFTPQLARNNPELKFIINRVSSPLSVAHTLDHEVRSDALDAGFSTEEIDQVIAPLSQSIRQYYMDIYRHKISPLGEERKAINAQLAHYNQHERFKHWFVYPQLSDYDSTVYMSRGQRYAYDPIKYFEEINIPMLYLLAGKDKNIPTAQVSAYLNRAKIQKNKDITIKIYPQASHYLYKYGLEDGPFEGWMYYDDYLDSITTWAVQKVE